MEERDKAYMKRAIELAVRGLGFVNPNPLVGAVIVKDDRIIGEGWHERFGGWHAERNAFRHCSESPEGATLYVTLEPCCHYGKTPPCTEAIVENRIKRVVVGLTDPNPLVAGKGIEKLRSAGIEVITGVKEQEIRELNRVFLKYISTGKPWVVMKTAMTLDGKIAAYTGDSRWVTGETARHRVQEMRRENMAILVGAGTVRMDDPLLNCRLEGNVRQPIRIIVDSGAAISEDSQIVRTARTYRTIVAYTGRADALRVKVLEDKGIEMLACEQEEGRVSISDLLQQLGKMGIDSILLEGGGELNDSFIRGGHVDEVAAFVAPKIVGGRNAKTPVEGVGFARMDEAVSLADVRIEQLGEDFLISGKLQNCQ